MQEESPLFFIEGVRQFLNDWKTRWIHEGFAEWNEEFKMRGPQPLSEYSRDPWETRIESPIDTQISMTSLGAGSEASGSLFFFLGLCVCLPPINGIGAATNIIGVTHILPVLRVRFSIRGAEIKIKKLRKKSPSSPLKVNFKKRPNHHGFQGIPSSNGFVLISGNYSPRLSYIEDSKQPSTVLMFLCQEWKESVPLLLQVNTKTQNTTVWEELGSKKSTTNYSRKPKKNSLLIATGPAAHLIDQLLGDERARDKVSSAESRGASKQWE